MGDAWIKGGRAGGPAGWSGEDKPRPRRNYSEHWMERIVRGLYHSAADEPVPEDMLEIVRRLPLKEPPSKQTPGRQDEPSAGANRGMLRKNVRDLHRLLDFKAGDSKEEMIATLLAEPQQRRPPGSPAHQRKESEMEHGLKHSSLRKRQLRADDSTSVDAAGEVDLVSCATIGFSSENPAHPVEHLFDRSSGPLERCSPRYDRANSGGV